MPSTEDRFGTIFNVIFQLKILIFNWKKIYRNFTIFKKLYSFNTVNLDSPAEE
jgi:hypothetical protein